MKVKEIVSMLNEGNKTRVELAKMLDVSTDSFRDELVKMGYAYDNSLKKTIFVMKKEEKNKIDEMEFKPKRRKGKENSNIDVIENKDSESSEEMKNDEKNNIEELNKEGLTDEEIILLKGFLRGRNSSMIFLDLSLLPSRTEYKKTSFDISKSILDEFEQFAKGFADKRITKTTLVELAMYKLMREYKN
ncbi:hypothetical protein PDK24_28275 [Bacillus cereus]|nr:hypothetical protein [Bacillus cereus]